MEKRGGKTGHETYFRVVLNYRNMDCWDNKTMRPRRATMPSGKTNAGRTPRREKLIEGGDWIREELVVDKSAVDRGGRIGDTCQCAGLNAPIFHGLLVRPLKESEGSLAFGSDSGVARG